MTQGPALRGPGHVSQGTGSSNLDARHSSRVWVVSPCHRHGWVEPVRRPGRRAIRTHWTRQRALRGVVVRTRGSGGGAWCACDRRPRGLCAQPRGCDGVGRRRRQRASWAVDLQRCRQCVAGAAKRARKRQDKANACMRTALLAAHGWLWRLVLDIGRQGRRRRWMMKLRKECAPSQTMPPLKLAHAAVRRREPEKTASSAGTARAAPAAQQICKKMREQTSPPASRAAQREAARARFGPSVPFGPCASPALTSEQTPALVLAISGSFGAQ